MKLDRKAIATDEFKHQADAFRSWVSVDNTSPFPLAQGRYHLYISLACPWASRTFIVRKLKHLEQAIGVTVADPIRDERGWAFRDGPGFSRDPINGFQFLNDAYLATDAQYSGRVSVPVLWDKQTRQIVNNSEDDICRIFNGVFSPLGDGAIDLFPADFAAEQDRLSEFLLRPYAHFSRSAFNAPPQAMTWSNIALTDFSWRASDLKTLKFSKSVNMESKTWLRTVAICTSAITRRSCSTARAPPAPP